MGTRLLSDIEDEEEQLHMVRNAFCGVWTYDHEDFLDEILNDRRLGGLFAQLVCEKEKSDIDYLWSSLASTASYHDCFDLNPWIDLPLQSARALGENQELFHLTNPAFTAPFPLKRLAPELIMMIADFLPHESGIALSLTNRQIFRLLARRFIKPDIPGDRDGKFKFLRLLERDESSMVACPSCYVLHHPHPTNRLQPEEDLCRISEWHEFDASLPHFGFSSTLNYNLVRAIARQRVMDLAAKTDKCDGMLEAIGDEETVAFPGLKAVRTTEAKFVENGELILRTQILVAPKTKGYFTPSSIEFLRHCLGKDVFSNVCRHRDIEDFFNSAANSGYLMKRSMLNSRYPEVNELCWWDKWRISEQNFAHLDNRTTAEDGSRFDSKVHPWVRSLLERPDDGFLRFCSRCTTELNISTRHLKSVGPVLVITVWKSLGGPYDGDRYSANSLRRFKWDSHCRDDEYEEHVPDRQQIISRLVGLGLPTRHWSRQGTIANAFDSLFDKYSSSKVPYIDPRIEAKLSELQPMDTLPLEGYLRFFGGEKLSFTVSSVS